MGAVFLHPNGGGDLGCLFKYFFSTSSFETATRDILSVQAKSNLANGEESIMITAQVRLKLRLTRYFPLICLAAFLSACGGGGSSSGGGGAGNLSGT